jgi:hypothetical protein
MPERPRPDIDEVRRALREHDEAHEEEAPQEEEQPAEDESPEDE